MQANPQSLQVLLRYLERCVEILDKTENKLPATGGLDLLIQEVQINRTLGHASGQAVSNLQESSKGITELQGQMDRAGKMYSAAAARLTALEEEVGRLNAASRFDGKEAPRDIEKSTDRHFGILESRAIGNLKSFSDNRLEYKTWAEKLANALGQARNNMRGPLKQIMDTAMRGAGVERAVNGIEPSLREDLWAVLMDKTEGEAHLIVTNSGDSMSQDGAEAMYELHKHFVETSGLNLNERLRALMRPPAAKNEWEIGDALERWHRNTVQLEQYDASLKLHVRFKVTATMDILIGKMKEKYDTAQNGKIASEDEFDKLFRDMKEDARKKKLEHHHKNTATGMDCDGLAHGHRPEGMPAGGQTYDPSWWGGATQGEWGGYGGYGAYSIGKGPPKGKGKKGQYGKSGYERKGMQSQPYEKGEQYGKGESYGKGEQYGKGEPYGKGWPYGKGEPYWKGAPRTYTVPFYGDCSQCGIKGHSKGNCPSLGKGFKGACGHCELIGHPENLCPTKYPNQGKG